MIKVSGSNVSQIVLPAANPALQPSRTIGKLPPIPRAQSWAPAWFYSALNWLRKSYYDASNVPQRFAPYMAGSDVDPYAHLGATRLFMVFRIGDSFRLTLAADANSAAPTIPRPSSSRFRITASR